MYENNLNVISTPDGVVISNPNHFLAFSDFEVSDGIDIIENINILSNEYISSNEDIDFEKIAESSEKFNESNKIEGSYISQNFKNTEFLRKSYENLDLFTFLSSDVSVEKFTDELEVVNSSVGFENAQIDISHVIFINKVLSPKLLLKTYKTVLKIKSEFFEALNLPIHIKDILNNNDFLCVASNVPDSTFEEENIIDESVDIVNAEYYDNKIDFKDFRIAIEDAVIISCEDALEKLKLSFGILDYLVSEGILIGDLVEAGMELCVGVEVTDELKEKLEKQILKSLTDINVITLLMAAIRSEEDLSNNKIREIDVSDDPAYLYTDEVLGLAISNQIAGTKATFNFKRYDEAKPGIIYGLGPMLDDIFAGLIAGCMSKIFEK
jgi:alpha-ribazole phosphatase CobZ